MKNGNAKPFLKWAGGKRWLAPAIAQLFLNREARYVEPFVGSGAVFFELAPKRAILADANSELMKTYQVVRDLPDQLVRVLAGWRPERRCFVEIRDRKVTTDVQRAARLIYLNRTAFNGLYRVNKNGEFNVPFGCRPGTTVCESDKIWICSKLLRPAVLRTGDFRLLFATIKPEDNVYIDPPYTVSHGNNGFRQYNEKLFSWEDQRALADHACALASKGGHVVVSNAMHKDILPLYPQRVFRRFQVVRQSSIAGQACHRGKQAELLLVSHAVVEGVQLPEQLERVSSILP